LTGGAVSFDVAEPFGVFWPVLVGVRMEGIGTF